VIRRENRFHGHAVIGRIRGEVIHSRCLSLRFLKNKKSTYRLAVVVSKKVASSAVTRNRIRRRLYEAVRTQRRVDNIAVDLVMYVKTEAAATMKYSDLATEVADVTRKALSRLN
jgi:ribonuclease P protein component